MIKDLSIESDRKGAKVYFEKLLTDQSKIELKKIPKRRTLNQNSYVHALFSLWGSHFGYSLEESKQVVKMELGYTYEKDGHTFLSKTSTMNTKELTEFIDRFRNFSAHNGLYLASSDEMGQNWEYFAREIERSEVMQSRYSY